MESREITQFTFGVSFNHMFKLLDMWGEIADDVLNRNKFFPKGYFTNISTQYTTERSLVNQNTGHQLIITANNLIYTHFVCDNMEKEYEEFKKRVINYIVPEILSKRGLSARRLGMVFVTKSDNDTIKSFAEKYFNPSIEGITDFRFSKKETSASGLVIAGKSDFINKIFTIGHLSESFIGISYDFQFHFIPARDDVRDCIGKFLDSARDAFNKDILEL